MKFRYEQLEVGELIVDFITLVYTITRRFPDEERYGLTSQVRRSAVSVYLNLAEGTARLSRPDFSRFITIALGSLVETHAGFKVALRMKYLGTDQWLDVNQRIERIWIMLVSLRNSQQNPLKK